jgi:hypothetical protein
VGSYFEDAGRVDGGRAVASLTRLADDDTVGDDMAVVRVGRTAIR